MHWRIGLGLALLLAACGDDAATGGTGAGTDGGGGDGGAADGGSPSGGNGGEGGNGGGAGGGAEDFGSGSRLRARHYDANPTARVFTSFVDTENDDVECVPGRATDGQMRCIPFSRTAVNYYADATCDVPVLVIQEGCPAPKPMLEISDEESPDICAFSNDRGSFGRPPQEVHRIGEATIPTELYVFNGVTCDPFDPGVFGEGFLFYPSTGVVAPSELAPFEVSVEPRDGGLAAEIISSEDGAWVLGNARNADTDELCANGNGICFPPHIASDQDGTYHTTADCTDPPKVAHDTRGCDPAPSPTIAVAGYQADPLPYELGDEVTATEIYRFAFGSCSPINPLEAVDYTLYELGTALDETDYPTYERVVRGESRVKISVLESPGGELLYPPTQFVDTGLGGDCQLARASDGKLHCISNVSASHNGLYFTDAACTVPFFMGPIDEDSHFGAVTPGCDGELAIGDDVYELVEFTGATYSNLSGGCVAAGTNTGSTLGENVGPDVFPTIIEVVD